MSEGKRIFPIAVSISDAQLHTHTPGLSEPAVRNVLSFLVAFQLLSVKSLEESKVSGSLSTFSEDRISASSSHPICPLRRRLRRRLRRHREAERAICN